MKRALFDIILFLSLFLLPWWVSVILAVAGIFFFVEYYEFMIAGVILYSLYSVPEVAFITKPIWFAVTISIVYIGIQSLRRRLILYQS